MVQVVVEIQAAVRMPGQRAIVPRNLPIALVGNVAYAGEMRVITDSAGPQMARTIGPLFIHLFVNAQPFKFIVQQKSKGWLLKPALAPFFVPRAWRGASGSAWQRPHVHLIHPGPACGIQRKVFQ